jgi:hypothetical protein
MLTIRFSFDPTHEAPSLQFIMGFDPQLEVEMKTLLKKELAVS